MIIMQISNDIVERIDTNHVATKLILHTQMKRADQFSQDQLLRSRVRLLCIFVRVKLADKSNNRTVLEYSMRL